MKHIDVTHELENDKPYGHYTMTLRDRNQNIIKQDTYQVHSLIYQHWAILRNTMRSSGSDTYFRNGGTVGSTSSLAHMTMRGAGAGASNDARGIVVGTSSATVAIDNTRLGGFIESGTGANELSYGATVVGYNPATGTITLSQTFTNNAVSTEPTVNEVGIAVQTATSEIGVILLIRDVPGSSYAMLLGSVLTVSYELTWPFGCQNFAMLFARHQIARNTTNLELYDATGTLVSASSYGSADGAFGFVGDIGESTRGIIVGTGTGAEAFNTYALGTQIAHGTNTGELFHYESTVSSFDFSNIDNMAYFSLSRSYKNKSGASVNIAEVGLSSNATIGATNFTYLFDRRVLGTEIAVADNESVTVTWAYKYNFT